MVLYVLVGGGDLSNGLFRSRHQTAAASSAFPEGWVC
jgi:hypothetical protein